MTQRQNIIEAIKGLEFSRLYYLLSDKYTYMDVSKDLFLERLEESLQCQIKKGFKGFDEVIKGTCESCDGVHDTYSFISKGNPSLNLCIDAKGDEVVDINLSDDVCNEFIEGDKIHFFFYKEETVRFIPGENYLIDKENTERAVSDFKNLTENIIVDIQDLFYWDEKYKDLTDIFGWNDIYHPYKYLNEFDTICYGVREFVEFYNTRKTAKKAMVEYEKLSNEKDLVVWLFKYRNKRCFNEFEGLGNWKKTGFIKFGPNSDIVVDCSECLDAFKLPKVYDKEHYRMLRKYEIDGVHDNGILYDLKTYLKLRKKYLDILPIDDD